jgi:hypothetical protein
VALIVMALATSVLSAVGIKHLLGRGQTQPRLEEELKVLPYP